MSVTEKPKATYRANRTNVEPALYTLKFELSDDPGETILHNYSKEACAKELRVLENLGYELVSNW